MKQKNSHVFLLKKVGGAVFRGVRVLGTIRYYLLMLQVFLCLFNAFMPLQCHSDASLACWGLFSWIPLSESYHSVNSKTSHNMQNYIITNLLKIKFHLGLLQCQCTKYCQFGRCYGGCCGRIRHKNLNRQGSLRAKVHCILIKC